MWGSGVIQLSSMYLIVVSSLFFWVDASLAGFTSGKGVVVFSPFFFFFFLEF